MRFIYGNDYGDVAGRELATDAARDSRYFNSLSANRAAQQLQQQQDQAAASNRLSWEQLLAQAAQNASHRDDTLAQRGFENTLSLDALKRNLVNDQAQRDYQNQKLALDTRQVDFQTSPDQVDRRQLADVVPLLQSGSLGDISPDEAVATLGLRPGGKAARIASLMQGEHLTGMGEQDAESKSAAAMINAALAENERQRREAAITKAQAAVPGAAPWYNPFGRSAKNVETDKAYAAMDYTGNPDTGEGPTLTPPPLARDDRMKIIGSVARNANLMSRLNFGDEGEVTPVLRLKPAKTNDVSVAKPRATIIKYDPRSGRPIAYDAVTKQPIGYAD